METISFRLLLATRRLHRHQFLELVKQSGRLFLVAAHLFRRVLVSPLLRFPARELQRPDHFTKRHFACPCRRSPKGHLSFRLHKLSMKVKIQHANMVSM